MKKFLISFLLMVAVFCLAVRAESSSKPDGSGTMGNEAAFSPLDVKVFPNPVLNKQFTLELSNRYLQEIRITNIVGMQVYYRKFTAPVTKYQVFLDQLPDGIYLLKVSSSENLAKTVKLLVRSGK